MPTCAVWRVAIHARLADLLVGHLPLHRHHAVAVGAEGGGALGQLQERQAGVGRGGGVKSTPHRPQCCPWPPPPHTHNTHASTTATTTLPSPHLCVRLIHIQLHISQLHLLVRGSRRGSRSSRPAAERHAADCTASTHAPAAAAAACLDALGAVGGQGDQGCDDGCVVVVNVVAQNHEAHVVHLAARLSPLWTGRQARQAGRVRRGKVRPRAGQECTQAGGRGGHAGPGQAGPSGVHTRRGGPP